MKRRPRRRVRRGRLDPFEFGLMVLEAYVRREGHACVPVLHRERAFSFRLGLWVASRRQNYRRGELSAERITALEALPGWVWNEPAARRERVFREGLEALRAYVKRHGHARVPEGYCVRGFKLWSWVARRRDAYRQGRLSRGQIRTLEAVPSWSWSPHEDDFKEGLRHLTAFARRYGHTLVPSGCVMDGFTVGRWTNGVRRRRRQGRVSRLRQTALERVRGWTWEPRQHAFESGLALVRRFAESEGHAWVPTGYRDGLRLDMWVARYRREKRRGRLSRARIRAFESIPGWEWERTGEGSFDRGFRLLRAFVERRWHCRVPTGYVAGGYGLHAWVQQIRQQKRLGKLTRRQERSLEALSGWTWEPHLSRFEDGIRHLRAFARREGHARVPSSHLEGAFRLGDWVGKKRRMRREGRLSRRWIAELEVFPGWVWDARR